MLSFKSDVFLEKLSCFDKKGTGFKKLTLNSTSNDNSVFTEEKDDDDQVFKENN